LGKARQASGGFVVARVAEFVQFVVGLGVRVNLECGMNGVVCTDMIMCVVWVMMDKEWGVIEVRVEEWIFYQGWRWSSWEVAHGIEGKDNTKKLQLACKSSGGRKAAILVEDIK
jgi:hypothetical protein